MLIIIVVMKNWYCPLLVIVIVAAIKTGSYSSPKVIKFNSFSYQVYWIITGLVKAVSTRFKLVTDNSGFAHFGYSEYTKSIVNSSLNKQVVFMPGL